MPCGKCLAWAIILLLAATEASAEWYADVYIGGAFTDRSDYIQQSTLGGSATGHNVKVNAAFTNGMRGGYWFRDLDWFGVGLDLFFFRAKAAAQTVPFSVNGLAVGNATASFDIPVIGLGFDVLRLRLPLYRSEDFPHGRVQPYLTAGPALFITREKSPSTFQPAGDEKIFASLGAKIGGGIHFQISKVLGLFTEYRYTHFTSERSYQDSTPPPSVETFKNTFDTHHVIGGLSFRFE